MDYSNGASALERKYCLAEKAVALDGDNVVSGYASIFGKADQGADIVRAGAYKVSLSALSGGGRKVKMLWQHNASQPIGVWDEVREDKTGLWVKGRILTDVQAGREALALLKAGAIEGLSIGYRTVRAEKSGKAGRILHELDLWEVSLVTFPMLPEARVEAEAKAEDQLANQLVASIEAARRSLLA